MKSSATEDPNVRSPTPYVSVLLVKVSNPKLITCGARSTSFEQPLISQLEASLAAPRFCAVQQGEVGGPAPPHAVPSARTVSQLSGLFREGRAEKSCTHVIASLELTAMTLPTASGSPGQEQAPFQR